MWIVEVPEGETHRKEQKIFKEIMARNVQNLMKNINPHIQKIKKTPHRINAEINIQKHYGQIVERQRKIVESIKRKMTHYVQGITPDS